MPPINVLNPVPSESRTNVIEEKPSSIYSTPYRPTQVMPSLIDIEEFCIELVDRSTGKGSTSIRWREHGQAQNSANQTRSCYQFIIE